MIRQQNVSQQDKRVLGGKRKKIHQEKMFGSIQACLLAPLVQHQQEAHGPHYSPEQWQQSAMVT